MYYKSNNHPKVLPSYCLHIKKLTMIIIINVAHGLYSTIVFFIKTQVAESVLQRVVGEEGNKVVQSLTCVGCVSFEHDSDKLPIRSRSIRRYLAIAYKILSPLFRQFVTLYNVSCKVSSIS